MISLTRRGIIEYNEDNVWHVYPVNDLKKHKLTGFECKCNPKFQVQSNYGLLVTHNAYDKREGIYEGKGVKE